MARINIEETAWANFYKLASLIGEHPNMVVGTVAGLWHESQEKLQTEGTREEIMLWAGLMLESKERQEKWIKGLIMIGFLTPIEQGFKISGNEIEIDGRVQRLTASAKGAESTKRKWAAKKADRPGGTTPTGPVNNGFTTLNAVQSNAKQKKNMSDFSEFNLEAIYEAYPRKEGKQVGMSRLHKMAMTQKLYDDLLAASKNYSHKCKMARRDEEHIKMFSSWLGVEGKEPWRDYIPIVKPPTIPVVESKPFLEIVPELSDEERKDKALELRKQLNKVGLKTGQGV